LKAIKQKMVNQLKRKAQELAKEIQGYRHDIQMLVAKLKQTPKAARKYVRAEIKSRQAKIAALKDQIRHELASAIANGKEDLLDIDAQIVEANKVEKTSALDQWAAIQSSVDASVRAGDITEAQGNAYKRAAGASVLGGALGALSGADALSVRGDINQLVDPTADTPADAQEAAVQGNADAFGKMIDDINRRERAGELTPEDAFGLRQNVRNRALGGEFGQLSHDTWLDVKGDLVQEDTSHSQAADDAAKQNQDLIDSQTALADALKAHIAAIEANTAVSHEQNAMAAAVRSVTGVEVWRALADLVSGQIGQRTNARGLTAGTGSLVLT
jgi:FtsZ-binding cell division protein ZapB